MPSLKELKLALSHESLRLLTSLSAQGIYGATPNEVAQRFIDEKLRDFVEAPKLVLRDGKKPTGFQEPHRDLLKEQGDA
jgi:hypothetical protein